MIHITEMPIKCPVAPLEFTFLADAYFAEKGMRDRVEIVYVTPLDGAFTKPVASRYLGSMLDERKITLDLDESARLWLADKGYDPTYGARPLKRVIQREVQDPLADKILSGDVPDGSTVRISGGTDKLIFLPRIAGGKDDKAA